MQYRAHLFGCSAIILTLTILNWIPAAICDPESIKHVSNYGEIFYPGSKITISSFSHDWGISNFLSSEETTVLYSGNIELPEVYALQIARLPKISAMKQNNPNSKILLYLNFRKVDSTKDANWVSRTSYAPKTLQAEYDFAVENDLLLKDVDGNLVTNTKWANYLFADFGNPLWQDYICDEISYYLDNYDIDGLFLDNGFGVSTQIFYNTPAMPINPRTNSIWTDNEVLEAYSQAHMKIKQVLGDKPFWANGIYDGKRFFGSRHENFKALLSVGALDGIMSEGLFTSSGFYSVAKWEESVNFVQWLQDNWLSKGKSKILLDNVEFGQEPFTYAGKSSGMTWQQLSTFNYASLMLGIKAEYSKQNYLGICGGWFEPWAQELYSLDLGLPLSDYYQIDGVYIREFEKGTIYVNPTSSTLVTDGYLIMAHGSVIKTETTIIGV